LALVDAEQLIEAVKNEMLYRTRQC